MTLQERQNQYRQQQADAAAQAATIKAQLEAQLAEIERQAQLARGAAQDQVTTQLVTLSSTDHDLAVRIALLDELIAEAQAAQ